MAKTNSKTQTTQVVIDQYEHSHADRLNNPPVGLVNADNDPPKGKKQYTYDWHIHPRLNFDSRRAKFEELVAKGLNTESLEEAKALFEELNKAQNPFLEWAGKAERTTFDVPNVSLHIHEEIRPLSIIEQLKRSDVGQQLGLFDVPTRPMTQALDFYKYRDNWRNRFIAGDSLLVMNSLLQRESMGSKVQTIYFDPPYGIEYQSNFQPFTDKKDVKDGRDEDLTAEPEMLKAFRDTWKMGLHSYLTYMRDRLWLAKDLLADSGSIFVQISDENVHLVRSLLDEVFGKDNFVSLISFATTSGFKSKTLSRKGDYIVWYAKSIEKVKFKMLFQEQKLVVGEGNARWVLFDDGTYRGVTSEEKEKNEVPKNVRLYKPDNIQSQGAASSPQPFQFEGKTYSPANGSHWKANYPDGMERLAKVGRIHVAKNSIQYRRFADDFPYQAIGNIWTDTQTGSFTDEKVYVVQTNLKVVERCLLMTTEPGDLVLDITCGSGTTAHVAETWGRRWITCDTSRVALTLAKQRLMTGVYPYWLLKSDTEGVGGGFQYKQVPHITLKSIANSEPTPMETLYDQPLEDKKRVRVCSPFTVEAVPAANAVSPDDVFESMHDTDPSVEDVNSLKREDLIELLLKNGIRMKEGKRLRFSRVEVIPNQTHLHATGETEEENLSDSKNVLFVFGNPYAPMDTTFVDKALMDVLMYRPRPQIMVFLAFQFEAEVQEVIENSNLNWVQLLCAKVNDDLLTDDLKKNTSGADPFWLIGQPEVAPPKIQGDEIKIEVLGIDYFELKENQYKVNSTKDIALWMLDTDYDKRTFIPRQIFFPLSGAKDGWASLGRALKANLDEDKLETFRGFESLPFKVGKNKRIAVKVIDRRGIESMKVINLPN